MSQGITMVDTMAPGRLHHPDDHIVMVVDIEDCPVADVPLTEIYDTGNTTLIDHYLSVLKRYVFQQIEDTIWLDDQSTTLLFDAGFALFHRNADGAVQSLRRPALQRLIDQTIRNCPNATDLVLVEILICYQIPILKLPRQSRSPPTIPSVVGGLNDDESDHRESQTGVSGLQSSAPQDNAAPTANRSPNETDLQFIGPPLLDDATGLPDETTERTNTCQLSRNVNQHSRTCEQGPASLRRRGVTSHRTSWAPRVSRHHRTSRTTWSTSFPSGRRRYSSNSVQFACADHVWDRVFRGLHATVHVLRSQVQRFSQNCCSEI